MQLSFGKGVSYPPLVAHLSCLPLVMSVLQNSGREEEGRGTNRLVLAWLSVARLRVTVGQELQYLR